MEKNVEYYLYMQFKEHVNRVNLNKLEEQKETPELELVANFKQEGIPIGMCPFVKDSSNSKIYLVGGERIRKEGIYNYYFGECILDFDLDNEDSSKAITSDVFVLDSSTGKISSADPDFPKPNAPKIKAKALANIDGKVYVLSCVPYYYRGVLPTPLFECFDSRKRLWKGLPSPPFYLDNKEVDYYRYHFVFGPKIYLYTRYGLYCYDVDECPKEWERVDETMWWGVDECFYSDTETEYGEGEEGEEEEEEEEKEEEGLLKDEMNVDADSLPIPPTWPYHSICFVEPGRGGLAVAYTANGLVGYLHATDGTLQHQQRLHFANKSLPCPNQPLFGGKVCYIDDNKFCLVLSGMINGSYWSLGVATFDVNVASDDGGRKCFYNKRPLCYHEFDDISSRYANTHSFVDDEIPELYDYLEFQDVFVLMVEHNRKRKHGEDNEELKSNKQIVVR